MKHIATKQQKQKYELSKTTHSVPAGKILLVGSPFEKQSYVDEIFGYNFTAVYSDSQNFMEGQYVTSDKNSDEKWVYHPDDKTFTELQPASIKIICAGPGSRKEKKKRLQLAMHQAGFVEYSEYQFTEDQELQLLVVDIKGHAVVKDISFYARLTRKNKPHALVCGIESKSIGTAEYATRKEKELLGRYVKRLANL